MSKELFAQCIMERKKDSEIVRMTAWIEARHKKGSRVRDEDGVIWTVAHKGSDLLPEDVVKENSADYRRHRSATDI